MRIAIQGEVGSFSHEAARRLVPGCSIVPCARSAEVFDRLERGSVAAAVIPIENSLAGSVTEHFDLLVVDELGYLSFSRAGAELLFQVFADRYERRSLLITRVS